MTADQVENLKEDDLIYGVGRQFGGVMKVVTLRVAKVTKKLIKFKSNRQGSGDLWLLHYSSQKTKSWVEDHLIMREEGARAEVIRRLEAELATAKRVVESRQEELRDRRREEGPKTGNEDFDNFYADD